MASYLLDRLHQLRATHGRPAGIVFLRPTGGTLDRRAVRKQGHPRTLRTAGLPKTVRLHDLRHIAPTRWLAAGESIYFVQQQLGHADIHTTISLYGHPDQAARRDAGERAAEWWREGSLAGPLVPPRVPRVAEAALEDADDPVIAGTKPPRGGT